MTAKPICVIYLPHDFDIGNGERSAAMVLMEALNGGFGEPNENKVKYSDYWKEYYWFCFNKDEITEPEFKVFYEKDFTEIQFQELKELITNSIEQSKTNPSK